VVVTATIADGLAEGTVYTQDFSIIIDFATPAQYREMALATPDAVNAVTISGDNAYGNNSSFFTGNTEISPFRIAKNETTYELWYEVYTWATHPDRGANKYTFANPGREGHDGTAGAAPSAAAKTEPVTFISWEDAVIWCNAYSEMSGKEPAYYNIGNMDYGTVQRTSANTVLGGSPVKMKPDADGYQLPTMAEWEYAARGGGTPSTSGSFVYTYAGSNSVEDMAWYSSNSANTTHPVGGKTANTLGLYDMSGNVSEWCWDWRPSEIGAGTPSPIIRGGSWDSNASSCEVSYWGFTSTFPVTGAGGDGLGFRVACP
jgi:formylglycine-generating enzyme required for sulfatase activity